MSAPGLLPLGLKGAGGFTSTRIGGASVGPYASLNLGANTADDAARVLANRKAAFAAGGLDARKAVFHEQVHGSNVVEALAGDAGKGLLRWEDGLKACDASFTRARGLALCVGHADCLAVVLCDAEAGILGVAHAGWRGALAGLPAALARRMVLAGAKAERLEARLSPCLGPSRLELGEEQHAAFRARFRDLSSFASPLEKGRFRLDLRACCCSQLLGAGVEAKAILAQPFCTASEAKLFFSHRRDQGVTGRHITAAWLELNSV